MEDDDDERRACPRRHGHASGSRCEESEIVVSRLDELDTHIEEMPKSRKWKLRDRVGERVRWYQEPEEVGDERVAGCVPRAAVVGPGCHLRRGSANGLELARKMS